MIKYALPLLATGLTAGLLLASPASAQNRPQPSEAQITALALYAMPMAFRGVQQRCSGELDADAYIYAQGDALNARLEIAAIDQFEPARDALLEFASDGDEEMTQMFSQMPADILEPFVGEMISAKVQSEVKDEQCAQINRGLELLDPLPAENIAALLGFIVNLVEEGKTKEEAAKP